jgi:uroporphyrinogen III methyltransferase/synthase
MAGKVYLVGAGIGTGEYLTRRGWQCLQQADVVVCDALADIGNLSLPVGCETVEVGKRGGKPSFSQESINRLLVDYCQQGKQVVRLKGGDPLIFGRARSEIEALQAAGCAFAVVPGVSSVLAVPALAGIPLTDAALSRGFAVVTAHKPEVLDWQALARLDTVVILMGGRRLADIVGRLQAAGKAGDCPIAIARWGGHPEQQVWQGTLADIVEKTAGESLSPTVMVVGEVVKLRDVFSKGTATWDNESIASIRTEAMVQERPLMGKTILVTRAASQASSFGEQLRQQGAYVVQMPALEIGPPSSWEPLDNAIADLSSFDWLLLSSANGVTYFFDRLAAAGKDTRALAGVKISVVGTKTSQTLEQYGIRPDFIPPDFVGDAVASHFPESVAGQKMLFPRVETGGRQALMKTFREQGAEVVEVPAYESRCPKGIDADARQALHGRGVDVVTFASSKTVKNFYELIDKEPSLSWEWLSQAAIASIGPQTSEACRQYLGKVDIEATEYTLPGLTKAIEQWYGKG